MMIMMMAMTMTMNGAIKFLVVVQAESKTEDLKPAVGDNNISSVE